MPVTMALVEGYRSIRKLWTRLDGLNLVVGETRVVDQRLVEDEEAADGGDADEADEDADS